MGLLVFGEAQRTPHDNLSADLPVPLIHATDSLDVSIKVPAAIPTEVQVPPETHLKIPKIGVDAIIKEMGVTSEGAMAVPGNRVEVGWFRFGTRPGEQRSAVTGGHSRYASGAGVFAHLDQLQKGDVVRVVSPEGVSISFVVRDMQTYNAMDEDTGIFESADGVHLNLITCSGDWDPVTKSYTTRLVVFTDAIEVAGDIAIAPN